MKVAAALEQVGVECSVCDLSGVADVGPVLEAHAQAHQPDAFGITATMPQMPAAAAIARQVREMAPEATLILGGPHVTLMNASARQEAKRGERDRATVAMDELRTLFDVLVCGDGEQAISVALSENAPTVIDADDPTSRLFLTKADLNAAPFPARHLIDLATYRHAIDGHRSQSLIAQLGCPFECTFCGGRRSPFLRRVRTRSSEHVISEMRHLFEVYGTTGFMFFDDELNVNRAFLELLQQMQDLQAALGVEFRMRGLLKAELLTAEMAAAMFAAGFRQILVGFESASPRILTNIQKKATLADNTRCVEMLHAAGLQVKALMSVGHAGESEETIEHTRQWLLSVKPDDFDVTIITVYPGTPYFDDARITAPGVYTYRSPHTGDALHARPVHHLTDVNFYKGVPHEYQAFVWTDYLTSDALCALRDDVEDDVRRTLGIPYPSAAAETQYEHSMGMR